MAQGFPGGGGNGGNYSAVIQQAVANQAAALRAELNDALNKHAAYVRTTNKDKLDQFGARIDDLAKIAQALVATRKSGDGVTWERRTDGGIVRIEDIPGRRVPFTLLVDIPIGNNTTSQQQQSVTISQEGPFVAVRRMATFMSSFQFQVTSGTAQAKFSGRSFGRYRPIHSAWDLNDSLTPAPFDSSAFFLAGLVGTGLPAPLASLIPINAPALGSAASSFRSMEFDGRITVVNAGSSYPRQNISVPSSFWSPEINAPFDLGALDFFERGEVLTIQVQPNHVNNPPAGNIDGGAIFGTAGGFPFLAGQFDPHEGVSEPVINGPANPVSPIAFTTPPRTGAILIGTTESVQRLPDGILTIGWEGYRIIQPVGPV
jgi:hypothetical protein